jgi:hypothetical protein
MRCPERSIAVVLALLVSLPGGVRGQEQEPPPPESRKQSEPREGPDPGTQRQFVAEGPGGKKIEISAGAGSVLGKDELLLKGYVDIKFGDSRLQADFVRYVPSTKQAYAEGNVILDQAQARITADRLEYNLETETGTFYNARGYSEPSLQFDAERMEKISKDELVLYGATFTACTQPIPYWSFKFSRGLLRLDDYAYLHSVRFKVGRVPIFFTPYLVWPIKTDRASGLLFPEFGYSARAGTILSEALYWAMRRNMDATIFLDYLSLAGIGTGLEYRFVPNESGRGLFTGYFIQDQVAKQEKLPGVPVNRWIIGYSQRQDYASDWHLVANANFISDFDYYPDFERDIRLSTIPQAYSSLFLTRNINFYSMNVRAERREQLLPSGAEEEEEESVVRLIAPEFELRGRRQRLGESPLFLTLVSSAGYFRRGEPGANYQRFDVFPLLSSQLSNVPWLDVEAGVGARDTYYSKSQIQITDPSDATTTTSFLDESFNRKIYQAGLRVIGPKLSRVFDRPDSSFSPQYKNTIEPTLLYTYTSRVTDPERIIPYDQIDTITGNANRLTYAFVTRLFAKRPSGSPEDFPLLVTPTGTRHVEGSGQDPLAQVREAIRREKEQKTTEEAGRRAAAAGEGEAGEKEQGKKGLSTVEIATLEISQDYSFLGPLSTSFALDKERQVSPIRATLRINPSIHTSVDVRTSFDILFRTILEASLSANLKSARRGFLDLTWSVQRDLEGQALLEQGLTTAPAFDRSQIGLAGETNLFGRRLLLGVQTNYELGNLVPGEPRLRDQRYKLGYNTQCCGFQVELLNRNFSGSSQREVRFLINLKGVGNVIDLHSGIGGGPVQ